MFRPLAPVSLACALALIHAAAGCGDTTDPPPSDEPVFPTGLAVTSDGESLVVVASDFDLRYTNGAVLVADLGRVRAATDDGDADTVVAGDKAYRSIAYLPPFGDGPVLSSDGRRLLVPTRESNVISSLDLSGSGKLSCGTSGDKPTCGEAPRALQIPDNDPATVVILDESFDSDGKLVRIDGAVSLLSSPDVFFFADDSSRPAERRMQLLSSLRLGDGVGGVRSMVVRPEQSGSPRTLITGVELDVTQGFLGALLVTFEPRADSDIAVYDVTSETGALGLRDMVLVPGADGAADALIVVLRAPEAIARYELDDDDGTPHPRLAGVAPSCRVPTSLAYSAAVDRVLLTCQEGDVVQMLDPLSLQPSDSARFEGRGPYDVVVNEAADPVQAYVSFFLDDSIGVFSLGTADAPALKFRGRIGAALPKPEDGRQ